jgi:hypothetical protein
MEEAVDAGESYERLTASMDRLREKIAFSERDVSGTPQA